ncbi:MAG: hypothetical protein K2W95_16855 [Candidatus Obscuribacterales bacterium]|nr:hypothetical protein [Candidatus Obscuribacterales bacterium]
MAQPHFLFPIPDTTTEGAAPHWWVGIVALNSDMAFTMTILTHGIPYMALIWLYQSRTATACEQLSQPSRMEKFTSVVLRSAPLFVFVLIAFAYLEEGLWDGLIWREHGLVFAPFRWLTSLNARVEQ